MLVFYDQLNREINLLSAPKRIISLVPSQTELLYDLGLNEEIIGITKFCIHPADKFKTKLKIGGTKQLDIELIKKLEPDLIIANKEENEKHQIEELAKHFPVWISDISNLEEAKDMIERVGQIVGRETEATALTKKITRRFTALNIPSQNLSVAYLIWRNPYMAAGTNTFIDNMLSFCGLTNVFEQDRYPEITNDMLVKANPHLVLLSSEPYPFKQKHIDEFKTLLPRAKVLLVDGEMFSWYGSRLLKAAGYFEELVMDLL